MAAKPKKKAPEMPKLGWKDTLFYCCTFVFLLLAAFATLLMSDHFREMTAFSNERVIACLRGDGNMRCFWLFFWLLIVDILVANSAGRKQPVFGRKDIKYGPPTYPPVYPLLSKERSPYWVSQKKLAFQKKKNKALAIIFLVTFLFSLLMFPLSLYGRNELYRDGRVTVYDAFDRITSHHALSDIEEVRLCTYRGSQGKYSPSLWSVKMIVVLSDGELYSFEEGSFRGEWEQIILSMLRLKKCYAHRVVIEGAENLEKVVLDQDLSSAEETLLYSLFKSVE